MRCIARLVLLAVLGWGLGGVGASSAAAAVSVAQEDAILPALNTVRQTVSAAETARLGQTVTIPDLTWDAAAAVMAQAWADMLLATSTFVHNPDIGEFGETIFMGTGIDPATSADLAVRTWAAEAAAYDWDTNACAAVCIHYTQLVWAATTSVGCGRATDGTTTYWVCVFAPPGNGIGERPYEPDAPDETTATTDTIS